MNIIIFCTCSIPSLFFYLQDILKLYEFILIFNDTVDKLQFLLIFIPVKYCVFNNEISSIFICYFYFYFLKYNVHPCFLCLYKMFIVLDALFHPVLFMVK